MLGNFERTAKVSCLMSAAEGKPDNTKAFLYKCALRVEGLSRKQQELIQRRLLALVDNKHAQVGSLEEMFAIPSVHDHAPR